MRVQRGSPTLHAEIAALEQAGRQPAAVYRDCTLVSFTFPFWFRSRSRSLSPPQPCIY
jgi:hypothetical protein